MKSGLASRARERIAFLPCFGTLYALYGTSTVKKQPKNAGVYGNTQNGLSRLERLPGAICHNVASANRL